MTVPRKTKFLATRITVEQHDAFKARAKEFGRPAHILLALINAFAEGRITNILPPVIDTTAKSIFNYDTTTL